LRVVPPPPLYFSEETLSSFSSFICSYPPPPPSFFRRMQFRWRLPRVVLFQAVLFLKHTPRGMRQARTTFNKLWRAPSSAWSIAAFCRSSTKDLIQRSALPVFQQTVEIELATFFKVPVRRSYSPLLIFSRQSDCPFRYLHQPSGAFRCFLPTYGLAVLDMLSHFPPGICAIEVIEEDHRPPVSHYPLFALPLNRKRFRVFLKTVYSFLLISDATSSHFLTAEVWGDCT